MVVPAHSRVKLPVTRFTMFNGRHADGYTPLAAVEAPRLHCSLEGKVSFEAERMPDAISGALEAAGYTLDPREAYAFYLGCVQLVLSEGGEFVGVADPRRDGSAAGPLR